MAKCSVLFGQLLLSRAKEREKTDRKKHDAIASAWSIPRTN